MISNIREVSTRGGNIFAIVNEGDKYCKRITDDVSIIFQRLLIY